MVACTHTHTHRQTQTAPDLLTGSAMWRCQNTYARLSLSGLYDGLNQQCVPIYTHYLFVDEIEEAAKHRASSSRTWHACSWTQNQCVYHCAPTPHTCSTKCAARRSTWLVLRRQTPLSHTLELESLPVLNMVVRFLV